MHGFNTTLDQFNVNYVYYFSYYYFLSYPNILNSNGMFMYIMIKYFNLNLTELIELVSSSSNI